MEEAIKTAIATIIIIVVLGLFYLIGYYDGVIKTENQVYKSLSLENARR